MYSSDERAHIETSSTADAKLGLQKTVGVGSVQHGSVAVARSSQLQRRLGNRQIQLIAIGGSIGTAVFVSIGTGLARGRPVSLLLAYTLYSCMVGLVNNSIAEMATYMPVSGGFIRMAGRWVDEAFGFMVGWNFFLYEALMVPFEIAALNVVLKFWRDDIPAAAVVAVCIALYGILNVGAVKWFGEAEFWHSTGKIALFFILFMFTFATIVGGNQQHDAYGFRYWSEPGPFAEYVTDGAPGKFQGLLGALWIAAFTIVGPEYVSMVAGEAKLPRVYLKNASKTTYVRFGMFFILSAVCVGVVVPYNDPALVAIVTGASEAAGTASASPYVIAMANMGIGVLPHVTNALLVSSIFSAGNALAYYATRSLFLFKCTSFGLPIYCLAIVMLFSFLAFLGISNNSVVVLPGKFTVQDLFTYYTMVLVAPITFFGWKIAKGTKFVKASEARLDWEKPEIDAYEAAFEEVPVGFWTEIIRMFGFKRARQSVGA
ncbi:amino acid permease-domain-containing protein [Achaetomium macrosporum]|uniref:Amino acid permease-domain-containing protein n=1 Tax=Achaetomium macrosporum TaxID=79813 RepID=A0AAN7CCJ2_9PEZI|nr:amino acid permease-domain-containing protein [Achaetomium macrosporum]